MTSCIRCLSGIKVEIPKCVGETYDAVCAKIKHIASKIFAFIQYCGKCIKDFVISLGPEHKPKFWIKICEIVGIVARKIFGCFEAIEIELTNFGEDQLEEHNDGIGVEYTDEIKPNYFNIEGEEDERVDITAVNGIWVDEEWAKKHAEHLSFVLGKSDNLGHQPDKQYKIHFIHNPTLGFWRDVYRYAKEAFGSKITPAAKKLADVWKERLKSDKHIIHIPHSEGCAITKLALTLLNPAQRARIRVIAIAPGSFIPTHLCDRVKHLASAFDFVPYFDIKGMAKYHSTLEILVPQSPDSFPDHYIYSKTYQKRLRSVFQDFRDTVWQFDNPQAA
jgi:hypothetical protein